jgi:hypothetical protein
VTAIGEVKSVMVWITDGGLVVVLTTETVPLPKLVTNAREPSGVKATSVGVVPTVKLVATAGVAALLITVTFPAVACVTYTTLPSGRTATPKGWAVTGMVNPIVLLAVRITDTVPPMRLAT